VVDVDMSEHARALLMAEVAHGTNPDSAALEIFGRDCKRLFHAQQVT